MATATLYLSGKSKWSKFKTPDDKYNNWKTNLYLDDRSMSLYKNSQLALQLKTDDDGSYIVLRRPVSKIINGKQVDFDPPTVIDTEGHPVDKLVGNGSDIVCKVSVYDTVKGKGHRLEKVMVTNLIEYGGDDTAEMMAVAGVTSDGNLNDEVPF